MQLKLENFRNLLQEFGKVLRESPPSKAVKYIIQKSGMDDMYRTGLEEDTERLENIMELVTMAGKYDHLPNEEAIESFMTDTSLASDQDSDSGEKEGVRLMTVHASKGLEFEYVFVSGLESELFPHRKLSEKRKSGEDSEEERRLFYVAVTRAGLKLILTWAETRTIFGTLEVNACSEFLDDISDKYTEPLYYEGKERTPLFSIDF